MQNEDIDAEMLLQKTVLSNRANYNSRLIDTAQNSAVASTTYEYLGYAATQGSHILRPLGGEAIAVGRLITNGAIAIGQTIQGVRNGNALQITVDEIPSGWGHLTATAGGAGAGNPLRRLIGFGEAETTEEPCGYKVINGEVEAQFECTAGDASLFDNAEDAIASVTGAVCSNLVFPMTAPINYAAPSGSVIQSARVLSGSWNDGTRLNQACPSLVVNEARTLAFNDFDTNYANNSGSCTYRICTKVQDKNYGCVSENGVARCAYYPDGNGAYTSLEECEIAIAPTFSGGRCPVPYLISGTWKNKNTIFGGVCDSPRTWAANPLNGPGFEVRSVGTSGLGKGFYALFNDAGLQSTISPQGGGGSIFRSDTCLSTPPAFNIGGDLVITSVTRADGTSVAADIAQCGTSPKSCNL